MPHAWGISEGNFGANLATLPSLWDAYWRQHAEHAERQSGERRQMWGRCPAAAVPARVSDERAQRGARAHIRLRCHTVLSAPAGGARKRAAAATATARAAARVAETHPQLVADAARAADIGSEEAVAARQAGRGRAAWARPPARSSAKRQAV